MNHYANDHYARPVFLNAARRILVVAPLVLLMTLGLLVSNATQAHANPKYASLVIDADTGAVIHERYADRTLHPASLVKMMTILMALEAVDSGRLSLGDRVPVTRHAASMVPSKLNLPVGSSIRVEDAIYALVTKSANDVAAALGEKIGGSEYNFGVMMTRRARQLGMRNTTFTNASGLHNPKQVSTARDMAILARHILKNHPRHYHYFSTRQFTYQGVTYRNHNRLMETYKGMDGFKTGFTIPAGYNLVASAKRGDRRLIGVVFGGRSTATRNSHMAEILDASFKKLGTSPMLVAANVPTPTRKPQSAAQPAAMQIAAADPAAVITQTTASINPEASIGELAAVVTTTTIDKPQGTVSTETRYITETAAVPDSAYSELLGEGDSDPVAAKRLETGLIAVAALKQQGHAPSAAKRQPAGLQQASYTGQSTLKNGNWSVQIGAFASRAQTDKAISDSVALLPADLRQASATIVPLKTPNGWLFRGRLSGYDRNEALRACRYIKDCLPVSPQAY